MLFKIPFLIKPLLRLFDLKMSPNIVDKEAQKIQKHTVLSPIQLTSSNHVHQFTLNVLQSRMLILFQQKNLGTCSSVFGVPFQNFSNIFYVYYGTTQVFTQNLRQNVGKNYWNIIVSVTKIGKGFQKKKNLNVLRLFTMFSLVATKFLDRFGFIIFRVRHLIAYPLLLLYARTYLIFLVLSKISFGQSKKLRFPFLGLNSESNCF